MTSSTAPDRSSSPDAAASLVPRLERAAGGRGAITFITGATDGSGYTTERVEWARLHHDARQVAAQLQAHGVAPASAVAILGPTSRELVTAIQATWLAGATVVMLPLPMRLGSIEEFVVQTRERIRHSDAAVVLVDPALAEFLAPEPGDPPILMLDDLATSSTRLGDASYERPDDDPNRLAILQFTSGSTADPKGVMLPHRCVTANLDAITAGIELDRDTDRGVSWLPLYHDMGLIGLLTVPMTTGIDLALAGPQDFLAHPLRWMQWISDFRATLTGGPNFAYALASRALRRASELELGHWRLALNGAEPIDPAAVEDFLEAGASFGLRPQAAFCVYGMAEATLAITFPEPGTGMVTDTVDRTVLEADRYAAPAAPGASRPRRLALLGRPLAGLQVRVCDPVTGRVLREREVGEIEISGDSVTPGYFRNPAATGTAIRDGWLRTGDLGYEVAGELVVCGRIKDVIIVGGRNVFPEDVERAAASAEGVRAGNVIAFGTEGRRGREAIVVVAETKVDSAAAVRDAVVRRVTEAVGIPPADVVLVRPGSLPKTSSGKLQRSLCRARYTQDVLEPV